MSAPELEAALARGHALTERGRLEAADTARTELAQLLELEPMGTRPDGIATWEDVIAYTAKALGSRQLAHAAIKRRTALLAEAVGQFGADPSWPTALGRVYELMTERTAIRALHRPRVYAGGGYGGPARRRCITCATYTPNGLHREDWPCATARAMGVTE